MQFPLTFGARKLFENGLIRAPTLRIPFSTFNQRNFGPNFPIRRRFVDQMDGRSLSEENEHVDVESVEPEQYDCKVCSAHATGFHFDAQSCSACAAFFRRAVSLSRDYTCVTGNNACNILYTERALCRACRMEKCLKVGMKKESVQTTSASKSHKTRSYYTQSGLRRNKRFGLNEAKLKAINSAVNSPNELPHIKAEDVPDEDLPSCSSSHANSQPRNSPESSIPSPRLKPDENLLKVFIEEEMKIGERRRIMFCERPVASLVGQTKECCFNMADIRPLKFRSFRKSIRTHLLIIYEWLRVWPAYHLFSHEDKVTCFRKCALYHTLLDPCFISLQLKDRSKFVLPNGGYVSTTNESDDGWEDEKEISRDNKKLIYWPLLNRIKSDILDQFFVLDLSFDEFVALKALITMQMTIPDVSLEAKRILNSQVDNIIQCLHQNYPDSYGQLTRAERIGNILMLLSPIFDTATNFVESHHQVQFFDIWQLDSLMLQFLQNKA
ncbi:unnamed protein product [Bursaphelenchus xylophilus]|uniref:(pine wood nematode) hypothetical protein n=1 Tax=Bursaphelenchus xylophilus TaxID=6326 RepID=A0A1I7SL81_BURXY|nr:unnamed protein product [Bursaphelenchus xylophilus]CAG9129404.1 unnamed protein product [Bursaphelenchus xylophilus]